MLSNEPRMNIVSCP